MAFEPEKITREHVLAAVEKIDSGEWKIHPSTKFDVKIEGKIYPPKDVMRFAHEAMNGEYLWDGVSGGEPTNKYLRKFGFEIIDKGQNSSPKNIFEENIDELKELINSDPETKDLFKFIEHQKFLDSDKNFYIWIGDNQNLIGSNPAHYEISFNKDKNYPRCYTVDLDFEGKEKKHDFEPILENLKNPLISFKWSSKYWFPKNSIRYDEPIKSDDPELITKLKDQLVYLEKTLGDKVREIIKSTNKLDIMNENKNKSFPLNQILFGPPGTGKTYNTINKALEIIGENLENKSREEINKLFATKKKEGQIDFTTFHQSMSYEDFIEGIKPIASGNDVFYEVQNGIFKNICDSAKSIVSIENFDKVYEILLEKIENENDEMLELRTSTKKSFWIGVNSVGSLKLFTSENKNYQGVFTKEGIRAFANGIDKFDGWEGYALGIVNYMKAELNLQISTNQKKNNNFVLIIDEINRGNVSAIFGELITLIEEDKRLGKAEALEVRLPYSKKEFGVPPNLYIIGTMNTADRSVEALDTALRRRFSFEEMPPDYNLEKLDYALFGFQAFSILKTLNERIEKLLDKDHLIGHSYFISKDEISIVESFYRCIIPLLQEYFFGDYGKIGLVLGKGFVKQKEWDKNSDSFAEFDYDNSSDFEERNVFEIIDYRNNKHNYSIKNVSMTFEKAIKILMKSPIE